VQASWSSGAIEQHGDTRGTRAHFNHYATPASQLWASSGSNLTHLKAGTANNSVDLVNHYRNPVSGKWIDKKAKVQIEHNLYQINHLCNQRTKWHRKRA
jgi:hypothetical protein